MDILLGRIFKKMGHKSICFLVGNFLLPFNSMAQFSENIFSDHRTGLVFSIYQGDNAFWIGSENGLFAVTGNHVKKFDKNNSPLFGVDIKDIIEDPNGSIWVSTFGKGVFSISDYQSEKPSIDQATSIEGTYCRNLKIVGGKLYVSCLGTIYAKSHEATKFTPLFDSKVNSIKDITHMEVVANKIYFVDSKKRLFLLDNKTLSEIELGLDSEQEQQITFLTNDSQQHIWGATREYIFKIGNGKTSFIELDNLLGEVSYIFEKSLGEIWVYQDSFRKLDLSHQKASFVLVEGLKGLIKQDIYDVEILSDQQFVFSSPLSGISSYSDVNDYIKTIDITVSKKSNIQYSAPVTEHEFLMGINGSLYTYELASGEFTLLLSDLGFVNKILIIDQNEYIISSDNNGLFVSTFNEKGEELSRNTILKPSGGYVSDAVVGDGILYFGVVGGQNSGAYLSNDFLTYELIQSKIHVDHVLKTEESSIYFDLRFHGLKGLDSVRSINSSVLKVKKTPNLIKNCLKESKLGNLWACTDGGGLGRIDLDKKYTTYIDTTLTYDSYYIRDLVEDEYGFLWVATNQGLVRFNEQTSQSMRMGREDGILDNDFEITASARLTKDKILIAGDSFNYIIDTKNVNQLLDIRTKKVSKAILSDLHVSVKEEQQRNQVTSRLLNSANHDVPLELSNSEYLFTLKFAANNFIDRNILGFEYRLLGLDDNWIATSPAESSATYSTLPAGDYTFEVRVKDLKSYAPQPITSLQIKVLPPFWQTWQAYFLYFVALVGLILIILKYRTIQLRRANQNLESAVLIRTNELAKSESKIIELLKQKETMFSHVSHELRTPLSLILGPLQKLGVSLQDRQQLKQFELITRNAERLSLLVDQILELEKLDSAKNTQLTTYSLSESLNLTIRSFEPIAELKNQTIDIVDLKEGVSKLAKDSLEKIISNLLINAVKYSPNGSRITISTALEGNQYLIKISDNGPGISKDEQAHIFERFTRVSSSAGSHGTGLGLAVVKELLIANDGNVQLESELGKGSTFTLNLPITDSNVISEVNQYYEFDTLSLISDIDHQIEESDLKIQSDSNSETILIIEDNNDMRNFLMDLLSNDYNCVSATDGSDGLKKATDFVPDLIISDLMMPVSDGFELTENIRSNELTAHIPIILLTAKGGSDSRMEAWKRDADEYIAKPFNNDELLLRISNLLSIRNIISRKFGNVISEDSSTLTTLDASGYYSERDVKFFEKFIAIVEESYSDESFNRSKAADFMYVSERQLNRKLTALINYSFVDYLRKYRLDKARKELEKGRQITEVAFDVGFSSASYFSHCFKAEFGTSPKAFVDKLRN